MAGYGNISAKSQEHVGIGLSRSVAFLQDVADRMPNVGFINVNSLAVEDEVEFEAWRSAELCAGVKKK